MSLRIVCSTALLLLSLFAFLLCVLNLHTGWQMIIPAAGMLALGARAACTRHRAIVTRALLLIAVGVGAIFLLPFLTPANTPEVVVAAVFIVFSALPCAIGLFTGIIAAVRILRELNGRWRGTEDNIDVLDSRLLGE